jgi:predicted nucleotide-binding protein
MEHNLMNMLEELKFNVEALSHAVKEDKKFFAAIYNFVEKLHDLLTVNISNARKEEVEFLSGKIEAFFKDYRPSGDGLYIPPTQTSRSDNTVKDIDRLTKELAKLPNSDFEKLKPSSASKLTLKVKEKPHKVFIGHGRSKLWARLQVFVKDELQVETVSYESESRVGESIVHILEKMLNQATFAVLVLTAEDQTEEGGKRARQNVIHEAGLFQGRLGFDKAILLVQRGLEGFTNVDGLQYIPFSDDNIEETFYQLQRAMKQKGTISV